MLAFTKELVQRTRLRTIFLVAVVVAVLLSITTVVCRDALVCVASQLGGETRDLRTARVLVAGVAFPAIRVPVTLPAGGDARARDGALELGAVAAR